MVALPPRGRSVARSGSRMTWRGPVTTPGSRERTGRWRPQSGNHGSDEVIVVGLRDAHRNDGTGFQKPPSGVVDEESPVDLRSLGAHAPLEEVFRLLAS